MAIPAKLGTLPSKSKDARMTALLLIIVGGLCAVAYGVVTIRDVMRRDAGTQRMQEIAGAIAEGADDTMELFSRTSALVDKAAKRGIIHKNAANRRKSRLAKRLNAAQAQNA